MGGAMAGSPIFGALGVPYMRWQLLNLRGKCGHVTYHVISDQSDWELAVVVSAPDPKPTLILEALYALDEV